MTTKFTTVVAKHAEPADMRSGARMFRLQDPDGFKLAISSEK